MKIIRVNLFFIIRKKYTRPFHFLLPDRFKQQSGLTLVEMLMYMGMFTILLTVLTNIFASLLSTQIASQATSAADQNGRYILSRLLYDIPRTQAVILPSTIGTIGNSLQIRINSINYLYATDASGNFQITDVTDNLPADNLNGYDASVSGVTFTRIGTSGGKNTIQVQFTVTSRTVEAKGAEVRNFQTTVGLR